MVACSGGADSTALTLALASFTSELTVAHIVHDLRPNPEALADRDRVRALSRRLGLPFEERAVTVRALRGNAEANARRARYGSLAEIATGARAAFVATAHHAEDQFESLVMALIRGAGPRGMRGIAPRRTLAPGVILIRPMLRTSRAECESVCRAASCDWSEDPTNQHIDRLRAALRAGPMRGIADLRPGAALAASRAAELLRDSAGLIEDVACAVFGDGMQWDRATLRAQRGVVLGAGLRRAAGSAGADRVSRAVVDPVVRAIKDGVSDPRRFDWPGGVRVEVTARAVRLIRPESKDPG